MVVTSDDIQRALDRRYGSDGNTGYGYFMEVPVGSTHEGNLRPDGIALHRTATSFEVHGFEVKVSRSDFLRDNKYHLYRRYCHEMTLVCPQHMVRRDEVPVDIGLMYFNPDTGALRYVRKPVWNDDADILPIVSSLLSRLAWSHVNSRWRNHYEEAKRFLDERQGLQDVGDALGTRLAYEAAASSRRRQECNDLSAKLMASVGRYDGLTRVLRRHGFNCHDMEVLDRQLSQIISVDRLKGLADELDATLKQV